MVNNSSTGGYLKPTSTLNPPRGLNLIQFIQTIVVGISGIDGTLVRPKWQVEPPKQPDIMVNWIAMGIANQNPDTFAFVGMDSDGNTEFSRNEEIEVSCSLYGPDALEIAGVLRDGLQIPQNLEVMRQANMGLIETGRPNHVPDLVNERFINRIEMSIFLRRQVQRVYVILPIVSAQGTIYSPLGDETYLEPFAQGA